MPKGGAWVTTSKRLYASADGMAAASGKGSAAQGVPHMITAKEYWSTVCVYASPRKFSGA